MISFSVNTPRTVETINVQISETSVTPSVEASAVRLMWG